MFAQAGRVVAAYMYDKHQYFMIQLIPLSFFLCLEARTQAQFPTVFTLMITDELNIFVLMTSIICHDAINPFHSDGFSHTY